MNTLLNQEKIIVSRRIDYIFFIFPIWVPILIILFSSTLNTDDRIIAFVFLAIVGESHFAATLFFFSKKNRDYILRNRLWFIYIPIILVILNTVLFLWNVVVTLVIASLMSAYHVTRQSIGINRLYSRRNKKLEYMIYLSSAWFVFYGGLKLFQNLNLVRFLPKLVESNYLNIMDGFRNLSYFFILFLVIFIFIKFQKDKTLGGTNIKQTLVLIVGVFMYSPYLFFDPVLASVLGVSIHWIQYLFLTSTIYFRNTDNWQFNKFIPQHKTLIFFLILTLIISVGDFSRTVNNLITFSLIIPLNLQLLHYFYDGIIWRASDPYLNENIFKKIFK